MISLKNTLKELSTKILNLSNSKQDMEWKELYSGSTTSVTISNISRYNEMVVYTNVGDFVQSTYILLNQDLKTYDVSAFFSGDYYIYGRLIASKSGNTLTLTANKYNGAGWTGNPSIKNVFAR